MFRGTKERDDALEILQGMTKAEIITWLSGEIGFLLRPPSKSSLLLGRYEAASRAAMARRERNVLADGVAKRLDELRTKACSVKDHKEFLAIAKEAEPFERAWKTWLEEGKAIRKEEAKADALFNAYMEQSEKERAPAPGGTTT